MGINIPIILPIKCTSFMTSKTTSESAELFLGQESQETFIRIDIRISGVSPYITYNYIYVGEDF